MRPVRLPECARTSSGEPSSSWRSGPGCSNGSRARSARGASSPVYRKPGRDRHSRHPHPEGPRPSISAKGGRQSQAHQLPGTGHLHRPLRTAATPKRRALVNGRNYARCQLQDSRRNWITSRANVTYSTPSEVSRSSSSRAAGRRLRVERRCPKVRRTRRSDGSHRFPGILVLKSAKETRTGWNNAEGRITRTDRSDEAPCKRDSFLLRRTARNSALRHPAIGYLSRAEDERRLN